MRRHEAPNTQSNKTSIRQSRAGMQAFLKIAKAWDLNVEQQRVLLGGLPGATYYHWKNKLQGGEFIELDKDKLERISYILGIYKALHILLPDEQAANAWVKKPNQAILFNGKTALDKMLQGNVMDLADVRRYLDAQRGW